MDRAPAGAEHGPEPLDGEDGLCPIGHMELPVGVFLLLFRGLRPGSAGQC